MKEKIIYAHRGLNTLAPENTMSAFRKVVEHGLKWIETDVDILGDGTVIICHDTELDRTTNRTGLYYDLTKADLAEIDAGSWFGKEFTGEPLPLLSDLVELMNETGLCANIEIKSNEAGAKMSRLLIDNVLAELDKLKGSSRVLISSFNHLLLYELHRKAPKLPIGCLYEECNLFPDWKSVLELVGADYIHPDAKGLTKEKVQEFNRAGFGVNVWTVNDLAQANKLFNWGVSGIFTDIAHLIPQPK